MSDDSSVCPRCGVGCRLAPGDNARARGVVGPANPDASLCQSGIAAYDSDRERLTQPIVRRGDDQRSVSWETAYDHAVDRLLAVRASHGPDALAFLGAPHCTNEENYLLQKLARLLGTNNVDNRARACHVSMTRALADRVGWAATTNPLSELLDSDVILVAGANPAERQPVAFNSFVRPAVNAGATLIHIDPVGNRTTRLASHHLAPRPGTDALVFDLLSATIIDKPGGVDTEFVEERTRGYEAFADSVGIFDWERAVAIADVDTAALETVADHVADADRVAALVGTGIEGDDGDAANALLNLLLATGNLGRPGTGVYVLRGLVNEQGATDAGCVPDWLPGQQPVTDPAARARVADEWGIEPPAKPGKTASELLESFGREVRGAVVVGENPAVSKRDPDWLDSRLGSLDTLIVCDLVASRTTRHAEVVFPVAAGTEKTGTVTNIDRHVQRSEPTVEPPSGTQSDRRVLCELGERCFPDEFFFAYDDAAEVFAELTRVAPTHAGISFDDLDGAGRQWPFSEQRLYADAFGTDDGRAVFTTVTTQVDRGSHSVDNGSHDVDSDSHGINHGSDSHDVDREDNEGLTLVVGGRASEIESDPSASDTRLRIHPDDAAAYGVSDADTVRVSNGEADRETEIEVTDRIRPGTVYLPASVADVFLRGESSTVTVGPSSIPNDDSA